MPAKVYWDSKDSSIIIREMIGDWTWNEYFDAIRQVHELMDGVTHRVDVIVDCRTMIQFPPSALANISNSNKSYNENMGIQVIVGSTQIVEIFAKMLRSMMPDKMDRFLFVNKIEDAYTRIQEVRESLSSSTSS